MNMFARFDENPAMTLQVIKKTKRYGPTDGRTDARTDNVKTVYPTTNKVCRGYNYPEGKKLSTSIPCLAHTQSKINTQSVALHHPWILMMFVSSLHCLLK